MVKDRIAYSVRRNNRAKRMSLSVYRDGRIVVTLPRGVSENIVEKFLQEKRDWMLKKIEFFKQSKMPPSVNAGKNTYIKDKEAALSLAVNRVDLYARIYECKYNKITIKNQKTRWGSCSKKGNLNFNYKILFLPEKARDYIIVHEICHLKELNHSKKFWALVAKVFPNYKEIRRELRDKGLSLP